MCSVWAGLICCGCDWARCECECDRDRWCGWSEVDEEWLPSLTAFELDSPHLQLGVLSHMAA